MSDLNLGAILPLPVEDRLELVAQIWDSIAAQAGVVPVPEEHLAELQRRLDHPLPDADVSWEELRAQLRRKA
jgi:putative addiction module component (TIGR02574 family)